jgi:hypothetical protein
MKPAGSSEVDVHMGFRGNWHLRVVKMDISGEEINGAARDLFGRQLRHQISEDGHSRTKSSDISEIYQKEKTECGSRSEHVSYPER